MNLAIDIGNTFAKLAVIDNGQVVDFLRTGMLDAGFLEELFAANPDIDAAIISSSRRRDEALEELLRARTKRFIRFDHTVPVPLRNAYDTPETLGPDRLAAAVGANAIYPDRNILIVDLGTAMTIDFVSEENEFRCGNISPGAGMRFRALHQFTGKLPLLSLSDDDCVPPMGVDSAGAIRAGVVQGIVYEIEGYIRDLSAKYSDLHIIFTGGDGNFFAKRFKNAIFATYDLVAYGLNRILEYNAEQK